MSQWLAEWNRLVVLAWVEVLEGSGRMRWGSVPEDVGVFRDGGGPWGCVSNFTEWPRFGEEVVTCIRSGRSGTFRCGMAF